MKTYKSEIPYDTIKLERAPTPEAAGISSAAFRNMLEKLDKIDLLYHSVMIIRGGVVAAERHRFPYASDIPHSMYSVSKSITGLAVGFAVTEGLFSLNDRLIDLMPEYAPTEKKPDEKLEKLTVRHLINLRSGKNPSYLLNKTKGDWARHFLDAKWVAEPGEEHQYVNECLYMLCAIIQKVTGISVSEYLTPRLWEPLGIRTPFWETDNNGIESGGWGIYLTPESFAKVFVCVQQNGVFNGKQVIPAEWLAQATLNQEDAQNPSIEPGYGYGFWRRADGRLCGEGLFGQNAIIYEEQKDVLFIFTCGSTNEGEMFDVSLEFLREGGVIEKDPKAKPNKEFLDFLDSNPIDIVPKTEFHSPMEDIIEGKTIRFSKEILVNAIGYPVSVLPMPTIYMAKDRAGNIDDVSFNFNGETCAMQWTEGDETNTVLCGMDGEYRYSKIRLAQIDFTVAGAAFWTDNYTLEVWLRPLESICRRHLVFEVNNGKAAMTPSMLPTTSILMDGVAWAMTEAVPGFVKPRMGDIVEKLKALAEPTHHGTY